MKLSCAIIDDEPLAMLLLEKYVSMTPFLELKGTYSSPTEAMESLNDSPVDVLFLDIQMPGINGLEYSRIVPEHTRVILTTAFSQYALEGYRVNALDYLLKPISYTDFIQAVNKAVKWFETNKDSDDFIYVKSEHRLIRINISEIEYIEGLKDYIKIHLDDAGHSTILSLSSIKNIEEKLPNDRFVRIHKSFIVNIRKVQVIERNRIVFGDKYIPISDTYRQDFFRMIDKQML